MDIHIHVEKKHMYIIVAIILLVAGTGFVMAGFNPAFPWHPLQQITGDGQTSVDENSDGIIDKAENLTCTDCRLSGDLSVDRNVGIRTTSPDGIFDVAPNVYVYQYTASGTQYPRCSCDHIMSAPECPSRFVTYDPINSFCYDVHYQGYPVYSYFSRRYEVGKYSLFVVSDNTNVGIGITSPTQKLDVDGYIKGRTGLCIGGDCRTAWPTGGGGGVSGSGSINYIPKWTGTTSLGNSVIYQLGSNVGIGTEEPGNYKLKVDGDDYGVLGEGNSVGVGGLSGDGDGVVGLSTYSGNGVVGVSIIGYGGYFRTSSGAYGLKVEGGCDGCSVIAEMMPVAETPNNGDIMCINPETGETEICREDKSSRVLGVAQIYAEMFLRTGCEKVKDRTGFDNGIGIGGTNVKKVLESPECQGWYPIALSGLSEETNAVCSTPNGKQLKYGDILVTSNMAGHLRPLDEGEDAKSYQVVGRAYSICAPSKTTDSIMVWIE